MKWILRPVAMLASLCLTGLGPAQRASAQPPEPQKKEKKLGWSDAAELSYVATAGNAEARTLGLRNTLLRVWSNAEFILEAAALRAVSSTFTRVAVGPSTASFDLLEDSDSALTAENYLVRGKYGRQISSRFFWYANAGWDRNRFAGIDNRYFGGVGLGNVWFDTDSAKFRTDYGLTVTRQDGVDGLEDTFAGLRLSYDYLRKLTGTTTFISALILDENLEETDDVRTDWVNAVTVAVTKKVGLKVSLRLLADNLPSLVPVPLQFPRGVPTGESVLLPAEKLDTIFTVALVLDF